MDNHIRFESHTESKYHRKFPFIYHLDGVGKGPCDKNWHENIEILYVIEGEGHLQYDSVAYEIKEGDIVIINSFAIHSITAENFIRYHVLIPFTDFFKSIGLNLPAFAYTPIIRDSILKEKFDAFLSAYHSTEDLKAAKVHLSLIDLLTYITEYHCEDADKSSVKKLDLSIRLALSHILSHYDDKITAETISEIAGFSKFHFLREFKKATGFTFSEYLMDVRLSAARKMLVESNVSIKEICYKTGFDSEAYFSKLFKEREGVTPTEYRKGAKA